MELTTNFLSMVAVLSGFFMIKIAELRVHVSNYRFLMNEGGEELIPKLMDVYYNSMNIFVILFCVERAARGSGPDGVVQLGGVVLLVAGLSLRIWAISSLGRYWTMRCVFMPGFPKVSSGPFRVVNHPEYLSRICDGIGLVLFFGAYFSLIPFLLLNFIVLKKIIGVEQRQLTDISVLS